MENRKSEEVSRRSLTGKPIKRDKDYYLNNLDVEMALHAKAVSLAERMFTAFMRENRVEVSLNIDDLVDKITKKLEPKLGETRVVYQQGSGPVQKQDGFSFDDDGPVILKAEKVEIKGELGKTSKSKDSIDDNLDILGNLEI